MFFNRILLVLEIGSAVQLWGFFQMWSAATDHSSSVLGATISCNSKNKCFEAKSLFGIFIQLVFTFAKIIKFVTIIKLPRSL